MKGILTFTLAAGVAITTTTIAHAAGSGKPANIAKVPAIAQSSSPFSGIAPTLDRHALIRELDQVNALLNAEEQDGENSGTNVPTTVGSTAVWTF